MAAVVMVLVSLAVMERSRSMPIDGAPLAPFVLWGAEGAYAWASPDKASSPRTYAWHVPEAMLRDLRKGPLQVEKEAKGKPGDQVQPRGQETPGEYLWAPLEPEHAEKD